MSVVVPAVLPASRQELDKALVRIVRIPSISRVQIDVVDGRFAAPASWPYTEPAELQAMIAHAEMLPWLDRIEYEIDLMCFDAQHAADAWLALGATRLTFHAESVTDLPQLLASARQRYGNVISFGLALNVASDLALLEPILGDIEYVQLMGIARIGRQGQPFDRRVLEKVRVFRERHPKLPVQVDGGVSLESAKHLLALGVSNLIVGSALLRAEDLAATVAAFEKLQGPFGT
ncbi:MAG: hypothetical protein ACYC75_00155 [Minisyncoccota bacterium]